MVIICLFNLNFISTVAAARCLLVAERHMVATLLYGHDVSGRQYYHYWMEL